MIKGLQHSGFGRIGFAFLMILLILLLGSTMGVIIGSKTRIKRLENRIVKLEAVEYEYTQLLDQVRSNEEFKNRFDRLEASFSRMDDILKRPSHSPGKVAEKTPPKAEHSPPSNTPPRIEKNRYHMVRSGETLYSIGQQYGLTVEKIRLLNRLSQVSTIYPGQKLLLSSKSM